MGKYAKFALVLLYVVQLAVLFRDQLIHLYRDAMDVVHRQASIERHRDAEATPVAGPRATLFLKRAAIARFDPNSALFALPRVPALASVAGTHHDDDEGHDAHSEHNDDKHKDRPKRREQRPVVEIMFGNLFPSTLKIAAHPQSREPRANGTLLSLLIPESAA